MNLWQTIKRPPWRTVVPGCCILLAVPCAYMLWKPGLDIRDGSHDRGRNGIWIGHGWLAADDWFIANSRTNLIADFRAPPKIRQLAALLKVNHITDVFPHLCPAEPDGRLPATDAQQVERFLDEFADFRVIPWIGGPNGSNARLRASEWRRAFITNVQTLLSSHPRLVGVQLNVEPLKNGDTNFVQLLEELRAALPKEKIISVAAYPPPTRWHPYDDLHWDEHYFREVARRSDQLAVMMYDVGQRLPKTYQRLMSDWTSDVLFWSEGKPVLLGVPTYDDSGVAYHDPKVENLTNALLGIHRSLSRQPLPDSYQGVGIYCEWETSPEEWEYFHEHFLKGGRLAR